MEYADVVATLALIFSLVTFLWNVFRMERWQKPAISIQHSAFIYESTFAPDGSNTVNSWNMVAEVVNVGDVATNIVDVYWEAKLPDGQILYVHGSTSASDEHTIERTQVEGTASGSVRLLGEVDPALPISLGRNETATWQFQRWAANEPLLSQATNVRAVVGYLTRAGVSKRLGYTAHVEGDWWDGPATVQAREELAVSGL